MRSFHGRFRRVDEDNLVSPVTPDEGLLTWQRERPARDERILAPADVAIGRTLADSVAVPNVEIRAVSRQHSSVIRSRTETAR